jgi:hypothetical protein
LESLHCRLANLVGDVGGNFGGNFHLGAVGIFVLGFVGIKIFDRNDFAEYGSVGVFIAQNGAFHLFADDGLFDQNFAIKFESFGERTVEACLVGYFADPYRRTRIGRFYKQRQPQFFHYLRKAEVERLVPEQGDGIGQRNMKIAEQALGHVFVHTHCRRRRGDEKIKVHFRQRIR